jgi:hypothetical protein
VLLAVGLASTMAVAAATHSPQGFFAMKGAMGESLFLPALRDNGNDV